MNIAILLSGQWRTNDTSSNQKTEPKINESILNLIGKMEELNNKVDIFITADNLDLEKTHNKFGARIKNIYLFDTDHIETKIMSDHEFSQETNIGTKMTNYINNVKFVLENIIKEENTTDTTLCMYDVFFYSRHICQYIKLYISYLMMKYYETTNNFKYDIILRIRPDTIISLTVFNVTKDMLNDIATDKYVAIYSDLFACGSNDIMSMYANLVNSYGKNHNYFKNISANNLKHWAFAPETQLFGMFYKKKNNLFIENSKQYECVSMIR